MDELRRYASELGLEVPERASRPDALVLIRGRQELLLELDREAMLDVVVWGRRPVQRSAGKEELARQIVRIDQSNYDSLSLRGLGVLVRLRGLPARPGDGAHDLIDRLRKQDGFWKRLRGRRRSLLAGMVAHLMEAPGSEPEGEYRFLPEDESGKSEAERRSLRDEVEARGLVGGIAQRLRGAADDYIRVKLDEIEARIDSKMNEIDRRLGEWRDREVANRLKILRLTLMFTVLVALVSLGYNMLRSRVSEGERSPAVQRTE
jgi:hypothetical protein